MLPEVCFLPGPCFKRARCSWRLQHIGYDAPPLSFAIDYTYWNRGLSHNSEAMVGKLATFLFLLSIVSTISASAQQKSQPSPPADQGKPGRITCHDQPYVIVTADAEQSIPLKAVATVKCNEEVTVLSDLQAYTVRVRTAAGQIGYVTRYEVTSESSAKAAASTQSGSNPPPVPVKADTKPPDQARGDHAAQLTGDPGPSGPAKSTPKPHIYVSDTRSWTDSGGFANPSSVANGNLYGGYDPEMTDIYQDFTSDCPAVVVTQEKSQADYAVLFDKGSSKKGLTGLGGLVKVNKVTVLSRAGETLLVQTSHSADTAVRLACTSIEQKSGVSPTAAPSR